MFTRYVLSIFPLKSSRHGQAMLQIKIYLLQELYKSILSYGMTSFNEKKSFMTAIILRPVCVTMREKVRKSHFVVFEFDFLTKRD